VVKNIQLIGVEEELASKLSTKALSSNSREDPRRIAS